ncbi:MAG: transposase [Chloroflexi bacterium]|nr:transposase [Chloroflexota bacterium]
MGNPLRLRLTAGQRHDIIQAEDMIVDLGFDYVVVDRSYTAQDFRDCIAASGVEAVIPPKRNAKYPHNYDTWRYRERHLGECFMINFT